MGRAFVFPLYRGKRKGKKAGYFARRRKDIQAVLSRDPAARSGLEVVLCYPGYRAVRSHRLAHWLWRRRWYLPARWISQRTARRTGIEIHPGAQVGEGLFIDHGSGVVIGETAVLGRNVTLYQGVTLGGTGKETGKRHPTVKKGAVISCGAKVLGGFTVGEGARIGAGAVVLKEIPPHATAVGVPARVVRMDGERVEDPRAENKNEDL